GTDAEGAADAVGDDRDDRVVVGGAVGCTGYVGGGRVHVELAEPGVQTVAHIQVVAFGFHEARVAVAELQVGHDAGHRVTLEARAARFDARLIAVLQDLGRRVGDDRVVDADLPPVQRGVEALYEARAPDQAQGLAGRGFRRQQRVRPGGERHRRRVRRRVHRGAALAQLAEGIRIG